MILGEVKLLFNNKREGSRVAIFGGSFNPPHNGHLSIIKWLLEENLADEVWVIPCYIHPFGKELASYESRLTMCRFAFLRMDLPVEVLDLEKQLGGVSLTLRTIEHLQGHFQNRHFLLVMGGDIEKEKCNWHEFKRIKDLVRVITIPRGEGSYIPNISSTQIRQMIESGQPIIPYVPREVAVHIVTHGLYR